MKRTPIVHCITNHVTVNDVANILLAAGAAPIMAHHPMEVREVTSNCDALLLNFGAMEDFESMKISLATAKEKNIPIVIDPVGVGGISFRRERFFELLEIAKPTCVRGNASEIRALYEKSQTARGVDEAESTDDFSDSSEKLRQMDILVEKLAEQLGCIVVASGQTDIISDGNQIIHVTAGHEMLTKITGTGCMSSALVAAFLSVADEKDAQKDYLKAVESACLLMGKAGEVAALKTNNIKGGTMTFRQMLIDEISLFR